MASNKWDMDVRRAMGRARAFPPLSDPRFAGPLGQRSGAPFHSKELQHSHVPQKVYDRPCSELAIKVKVKFYRKSQ
jgi:hypothetical protein